MVDPDDDPAGFHAALKREAWCIAAAGQPSDIGQLVLRTVAASVTAAMPEARTETAAKALVVLAHTEWDAAANAMAALFLAGRNRLVAQDLLAGGNVVALSERTP